MKLHVVNPNSSLSSFNLGKVVFFVTSIATVPPPSVFQDLVSFFVVTIQVRTSVTAVTTQVAKFHSVSFFDEANLAPTRPSNCPKRKHQSCH
jgi:hypothetical protein